MKFITFLIVSFILFGIIFNLYDANTKEASLGIVIIFVLVILLGGMTVLGKKYKDDFKND